MDEARAVLARLGRIEALERTHAPAEALLAEVRALLREAEEWLRAEPSEGMDGASGALERLRLALSHTSRTLLA